MPNSLDQFSTGELRREPDSKHAHLCPVCGFWMDDEPNDWNICSCCGVEFNLHDAPSARENRRDRWATLRSIWIENGFQWWSEHETPPDGWDPEAQLAVVERVYGS